MCGPVVLALYLLYKPCLTKKQHNLTCHDQSNIASRAQVFTLCICGYLLLFKLKYNWISLTVKAYWV